MDSSVLVINAGSSSLKLGLYECKDDRVVARWDDTVEGPAAEDTLAGGMKKLRAALGDVRIGAVGHRIVHGGPSLTEHCVLDATAKQTLRDSAHFAPLHVPAALRLVDAAEKLHPGIPQVACFDTAFHRTLPPVASRLPLPATWDARGIRRYGFHGLSYESIVHRLGTALPTRVVIAHLGSGASLAAVRSGRSIDTSMGMTPTGGIVMGTRSGDLDPGVLVHLLREEKLDANALETLVNHDAGLAGISGGEHDMRALHEASGAGDEAATLAIDIFCASVKKYVASYAAVLGGIDLLVFAGGIGEHSADVRAKVCADLSFMGVVIDEARNEAHAPTLSADESKVRIAIVASEEDLQIARHVYTLVPGL